MRTEWIVIAVLAVLALAAIAVFNRLVRQRNLVREGWSGIDVQLKRRSDLPQPGRDGQVVRVA
jgi:LemA protein